MCRKSRELRRSDDLVGDEHIADAGCDERLRFADFLAADTDGAALDLQVRDVGALVRLRVWTERDARAARRVGHQVEVALEGVEVDDERGRVDVVDGVADAGGNPLHERESYRAMAMRGVTATSRGGLERSQLPVDDLRDLEELRAVELARDRVAAVSSSIQ